MHLDPYIALGSAVIGLLVGMTGVGGGALMTPMLIMVFGVKPSTAISSDLVAAVLMKPFGASVHLRRGTVNLHLVKWLALGSVPAAFVGAYLLHLLGSSSGAEDTVQRVLGVALLVGVTSMIVRAIMDRRGHNARTGSVADVVVKPLPTLAIGLIGGFVVGMTSVGSGSMMIVLMLFLYPAISAKKLVGTDITQAVPLTVAAACGALLFGHVEVSVTTSMLIGAIPAVIVGSLFSSRAPDGIIRPIIGFAVLASGLKYVGLPTVALGWTLLFVALAMCTFLIVTKKPWQRSTSADASDEPAGLTAP
ncbi:MAG: sulfite exporter TauE/SafE family protein [Actinomycetes bacterium]